MKLDDINKSNIHKVPDGYFDTLPDQIKARIDKQEGARIIPVGGVIKYGLPTAIAAGIALLIMFGNPFGNQAPVSAEQMLASIRSEDIIEYLEYSDITASEIIEMLDISDVDELVFDEPVFKIDNDLNEEALDDLMLQYGDIDDLL